MGLRNHPPLSHIKKVMDGHRQCREGKGGGEIGLGGTLHKAASLLLSLTARPSTMLPDKR